MIPNELEKLVLCQKAFSKTITIGRSGQLVIPVAEDSTVIIWNFDYMHFIDVLDFEDMDEVFSRSVHQVQFRSEKSNNNFIIRDDVTITEITGPGGLAINEANVVGHYLKDVYLIHSGNIVVTISVAPPLVGTVTAVGSPPNRLKPQSPPLGYGSDAPTAIVQTTNEIYPAATGEVIALSTKFGVSSIPTPMPSGDLRYPIGLATALNPTHITSEQGQRSYPILNINYVELPRNVAEDLFSST